MNLTYLSATYLLQRRSISTTVQLLNDHKARAYVLLRKEYINKTTPYMLISMFIHFHIPRTKHTGKCFHASGHFIMAMNLNGLTGAKLAACINSLSGLSEMLFYLEEGATWVTPENSQLQLIVLNRQMCPSSPFLNQWTGIYLFDLVGSRRTVIFASVAIIWTINLFVLVTSRWTVYLLWWRVGEICIYSSGE